jgi:DNA-binding response OmpR family regulator
MEEERTLNPESGPGDETTVLLIEGDPLIRESYCRELARAGFRVKSASTGVAGLRHALANPPDLIVLEIRLPGLDGQIALEQFRSHVATRNLPVVVLSKCGEAELVKHGLRPDAFDYLVITGR